MNEHNDSNTIIDYGFPLCFKMPKCDTLILSFRISNLYGYYGIVGKYCGIVGFPITEWSDHGHCGIVGFFMLSCYFFVDFLF